MRHLLPSVGRLLLFALLTLVTQVGGLSYLLSSLGLRFIPVPGHARLRRRLSRMGVHVGVYLVLTFGVVPPLAAAFGRVPLPAFGERGLRPRTFCTVLLNRRYVRPGLREVVTDVSARLAGRHPGFRLNYFDANFPFRLALGPFRRRGGFPLYPHLSHNDGRKVDLGFVYRDAVTGALSRKTPSAIGYGISEEPLPGEYDRPSECRGHWMYSFLRDVWPQGAKADYYFDPAITRELVQAFADDSRIAKVLLEPHLKTRLRLRSGRISGVQCGSVRHDDHLHVQIR